jgi:hypothetical protein
MSADTESDIWERAVCAFCGALLGGVVGLVVEMLHATTVGAPMSISVVGIFVLIGIVLGLWIGSAVANGVVALCSFLLVGFPRSLLKPGSFVMGRPLTGRTGWFGFLLPGWCSASSCWCFEKRA